jgi:hypothetical protein
VDTQPLVDVPQVVFHRLGRQEQRGRGLPGGFPAGEQQRDLQLLRRQHVGRAGVPWLAGFPGGGQLGAGPLGPRPGVERLERVRRRA